MTSRPLPPREDRVLLWLCLVGCLLLLAVAAWLKPDPRGFGTHEQLGLLPCGFLRATGLPCPTCGMTTSFACMVRGRFPESAAAQPFGAFLCLMVAASTVGSLRALAWGYPFQARLAAVRWLYIGPGLGVFFFLSWAYGCARALGKL